MESPSPRKSSDSTPLPAIYTRSSPRFSHSSTSTSPAHRRIAIAVDLSDESAFAVKWAVENYLRPGDGVIILHVRPTSVLYGADWGSTPTTPTSTPSPQNTQQQQEILEEEFDELTTKKANDLARPLIDANISFKIHIVKDHDMKERLCLEVERLGLSAAIMGSRGFGAARRRTGKGRLGSVSDYCVHHCVCPVIVVRYPDDVKEGGGGGGNGGVNGGGEAFCGGKAAKVMVEEAILHPVPEEDQEYHDADEEDKDQNEIDNGN